MKVTAILPPFLPIEDIRKTASSILPGIEIRTDLDFTGDKSDVLIATTFTHIGKEELDKFPSLKFLQIASTGYDNVDLDEVKKRNIILCNSPTFLNIWDAEMDSSTMTWSWNVRFIMDMTYRGSIFLLASVTAVLAV